MQKYKVFFQNKGILETKIISTSDLSKVKLPTTVIKIEKLNKKYFQPAKQTKIKKNEISNVFFELNIILKAKIPMFDAILILEKSTKNILLKEILQQIKYSLENGTPIYKSLQPYEKHLGSIVISFFKIAQENGNLEDCIYSLSVLLRNIEENKKLIHQKLRYPIVLLITLFFSLFSIFSFVIPQFEFIFEQYNTTLPFATVALLNTKDFVVGYFIYFVIFFTFTFLYLLTVFLVQSCCSPSPLSSTTIISQLL